MDISLSAYSFELLVDFCHSNKLMIILSILNQRLNIKVFQGLPAEVEDEANLGVVAGDANTAMPDKDVKWGVLRDDEEEKIIGEKELEGNSSKDVKSPESKKQKKDDKASKDGKPFKSKTNGPVPVDAVPMPSHNDKAQLEALEDLRKRVSLSGDALPSIAFYTFANSQDLINCMDTSPNGQLVAAGCSNSSVCLWDLAERDPVDGAADGTGHAQGQGQGQGHGRQDTHYKLIGHSGAVFATAFSPDSAFLLSASEDATVKLWSTEWKTPLVAYKGHNYPIWDVAFSSVGYYFATASHDRTARLWSTDRVFPLRVFAGHLTDVNCVRFHANCNYLATGSADKCVRLWDMQSGECVRLFLGHRDPVYTIALSPDGKLAASGSESGSVYLWDIPSGKAIANFAAHRNAVWSLAFSGEGSILASGAHDGTVRLWDVKACKEKVKPTTGPGGGAGQGLKADSSCLVRTFPTRHTRVFSVRFSPRNLLLAGGLYDPPKITSR
eukprot:TRINITY_DN5547_c0_g1::TRINITY_DN5547_c0_g1_i1::g.9341::m.9341 TRINITY_DN5547_c0_g1::TRINITY_DN5547_c0_g1_i1::g.9341  ORF type:complete len:562 (-),score=130.20,sp/Q6S7B0/TAF5_ARATH/40.27/8e-157,WD40/PF00400.27/4.8e-05,WD40/PF00400.27/1.7e-08,WD40/PF00400.27/1.3e-09,WD40/PF00400.27/8.1e-12,WD40/PF00400.27/4.1e-09,WD40/PF00400.27/2e-10,WD40/PF00400.27/49,TFIID_90kDa/PF04494.10/1.4e-26,Nbas_N/PF15492.1/18,Nbas_N/PF15492.1/0.002,Nbas_N/PF15492.1/13,Nup160/PF11715.3/0.32,Nup160/PF11715.3/4.1e+02,Nup1